MHGSAPFSDRPVIERLVFDRFGCMPRCDLLCGILCTGCRAVNYDLMQETDDFLQRMFRYQTWNCQFSLFTARCGNWTNGHVSQNNGVRRAFGDGSVQRGVLYTTVNWRRRNSRTQRSMAIQAKMTAIPGCSGIKKAVPRRQICLSRVERCCK